MVHRMSNRVIDEPLRPLRNFFSSVDICVWYVKVIYVRRTREQRLQRLLSYFLSFKRAETVVPTIMKDSDTPLVFIKQNLVRVQNAA